MKKNLTKKLSIAGILSILSLGTTLAQTPFKVITPGPNPLYFVELNGIAYFDGRTNSKGSELWKSDGTAAGTVLIKDLNPCTSDGSTGQLFKMGTNLYFSGFNNNTDPSPLLYKSDGTAAGTAAVSSLAYNPRRFTEVNGTLFYIADGSFGSELYKTDGKTASLVKDIRTGAASSSFSLPMINYNGILYFVADDGNGGEVWRSDGTVAGTTIVKPIYPSMGSNPTHFTIVNNILFFTARDGINGNQLWKTDGTAVGTTMVAAIFPGHDAIYDDNTGTFNMVALGTKLYFPANDGVNGTELWMSDGTQKGTVMVKDILPGAGSSNVLSLKNANGTLYFNADNGTNGSELWKSDGTAAGTVLVADINPKGSSNPRVFTAFNNAVYFLATEPVTGSELWKTDGTTAGTVLVKDIYPGTSGQDFWNDDDKSIKAINGKLFFQGIDGTNGVELWEINSGVTGTSKLDEGLLFKIFPNPVLDILSVHSDGLKNCSVEISNMQGQVLIALPLSDYQNSNIDVKNLPEGIYIIKFSNSETVCCTKFIKK
jgi:ELWxxDGT repeat protein